MEDLRMRGEERREERAEVTCVTTTGPGEKVVSSSHEGGLLPPYGWNKTPGDGLSSSESLDTL